MRKYAVIALLVVIVLSGYTCADASPAGKRLPLTLTWQNAVFEGNSLVQVGAHKLPAPVVFPKGLLPPWHKALVFTSHDIPGEFGFDVFFSSKQEHPVVLWYGDASVKIPLGASGYVTGNPNSAEVDHVKHTWTWGVMGKKANNLVVMMAQCWAPAPAMQSKDTATDERLFFAIHDPQSPVRTAERFESLFVVFRTLPSK